MRRRRACARRWRRTRDPSVKAELKLLSHQIDIALDGLVNSRFASSVERLDRDPAPIRKKLLRLVKNLSRKSTAIPPLRTEHHTLVTPAEKCEAFANHLTNLPGPRPSGRRKSRFERDIENCVNVIDSMNQSTIVPQISLSELKFKISCLKNGKASGIDLIDNRPLKHLPDLALRLMVIIFNSCLAMSYFPKRWKQSFMTCICKPGKPKDKVSSYRMISMLPTPGKLLERFILFYVNDHLDENDLIIPQQYGFRKGKSCTHQLYRVAGIIWSGLMQRKTTDMLSLDLTSAFDCVA